MTSPANNPYDYIIDYTKNAITFFKVKKFGVGQVVTVVCTSSDTTVNPLTYTFDFTKSKILFLF
jgi:hypothetical protein